MCVTRSLALVLAWSTAGSLFAAGVTVNELNKEIVAAAANHRSDADTARRIAGLQVSERITADTLAALQSHAPGPRTAATLEELMAQGAFLAPPAAEVSRDPPPSLPEQKSIFEHTVNYVLSYAHRLPNLLCIESILRFDDNALRSTENARILGKLHFLDLITAQVTYSQGDETVAVKAVNGKPFTGSHAFGITTSGEFGNEIVALMQPKTRTKASWSHWELLHGKRMAVFQYSVLANNSQYFLSFGCAGTKVESVRAAYYGLLFIEPETGTIVRITRRTQGLPASFPTKQADTAIEYGPVSIGGESYMLPIRSVTDAVSPAGCDNASRAMPMHTLNEIRFTSYRLFQAESKLVASSEPNKPDSPARADSKSSAPAETDLATKPEPETTETAPAPESGEIARAAEPLFSLPGAPPFRESGKPEISNREDTFATHAAFRERVSVVTVPVIVRDREGRTVHGLDKDDFELIDNGKRQMITNFAEQQTAPGVATRSPISLATADSEQALPGRYVAYVFDDLHLNAGDLARTRAAAERVYMDLLTSGTRLAILTISGKVSLGFTDDRSKLLAAFGRLRPNPIPRGDCPEISHYMADRIVRFKDTEALSEEAKAAISLCGVDPRHPEIAERMASSAARRSLETHDYETRVTLDAIRGVAQGMAVLPGERSAVFVSPGFYTSPGLPGLQEVIDRAARSGLVIQALDARGLAAPAGYDVQDYDRQAPSLSQVKMRYQQTEQILNADVLAQLAEATGGTVFQNSNDYDAGFRRLSERPGVVYLIAFSPSDDKGDGTYHKLKVAVEGHKGVEVQARRGYMAHKALSDAGKEAQEEIQNALWSRDEMHDIPMTVKSAELDAKIGRRKLNLLLGVDPKPVQFQRAGGRNRDKLSLTFGLFDADGAMLSVLGQDVPLDFSDNDLSSRLDAGLRIRVDLDIKPGARFMRVVLRDAEGQMATVNEVISQ